MAFYLKKPALICIALVVCLYLYLSKNNDKTETDDYYDKDCDYIQEQYGDPEKSPVDEPVERIEEKFCRNPQTCWDEEKYCSSILHFFTMLRNGCMNFVALERENNLEKGKFRRENNGGIELVDDFIGNSDVEMCKLNKEGDEKMSKSFCSRNEIEIQEINYDKGNTKIREKVGNTGKSTDAILTHGNVDNLNLIDSTQDVIDDEPKFNEDDGEKSLKRNGEDENLDDDDIEGMTKKDVEDDDTKTVDEDKENMSLAYLVLFSLLVMSTAASLLELLRERKRRKVLEETADDGNENGAGFPSGRRMSLVDLTVSRHARKEQQIESIIKHSGSSRAPPPPLLRRCSFPAQVPEGQGQSQGQKPASPKRQLTWSPPSLVRQTSRRLSVDYGDDDSSPDRRRVRIIRRH